MHCLIMHDCFMRPGPPNFFISLQKWQSPHSVRRHASHFRQRVLLRRAPDELRLDGSLTADDVPILGFGRLAARCCKTKGEFKIRLALSERCQVCFWKQPMCPPLWQRSSIMTRSTAHFILKFLWWLIGFFFHQFKTHSRPLKYTQLFLSSIFFLLDVCRYLAVGGPMPCDWNTDLTLGSTFLSIVLWCTEAAQRPPDNHVLLWNDV